MPDIKIRANIEMLWGEDERGVPYGRCKIITGTYDSPAIIDVPRETSPGMRMPTSLLHEATIQAAVLLSRRVTDAEELKP